MNGTGGAVPADRESAVPTIACRLVVTGRVQAVGFRPFVYRLAHAHGIRGWVCNTGGSVTIHAEGPETAVERFREGLSGEAPPLARPRIEQVVPLPAEGHDSFELRPSHDHAEAGVHVPPDQFACDDCLAEVRDPAARRYRYPFINCTQCGPRYTIIHGMPYDRPRTTMAAFELCADCHAEYTDPLDRRFHAQPLACPACGPQLIWRAGEVTLPGNEPALAACRESLAAGGIVAVRGIGGYHLICDATDAGAVDRLRRRKQRPDKPLAVMVPEHGDDGLDGARALAIVDTAAAEQLRNPMRPIVLVSPRADGVLAPGIAPGLDEVGLMLPYSPLHHLLLGDFGGPLVATSGNLSGEPVLTEPGEAEHRLGAVADAFVHHDRPIERPADDPVYRVIGRRARPLRLGRGNAPLERDLPVALATPTLAVGAFLKNTVALGWDRRAVVSPHLGDLESPRARQLLARVVADLQQLYGVQARAVACDAHPGFPNSRWARDSGLEVIEVLHHEAHASALAGELGIGEDMLVFTWDGVGYGADGDIQGGEALLGSPGSWRRAGSLRRFRLPGGDAAAIQPWRTALSLAWETGTSWRPAGGTPDPLLHQAWERGINAPPTSAAGRLFDGASALCGLISNASFEGQGPALLEAAAADDSGIEAVALAHECDVDGIWRIDWAPLVALMMDGARPLAERSAVFHASLAGALAEQARRITPPEVGRIGLAGGVFQNRRLCAAARKALTAAGYEVVMPRELPVNDAAISYGQLVEAAYRGARTDGRF